MLVISKDQTCLTTQTLHHGVHLRTIEVADPQRFGWWTAPFDDVDILSILKMSNPIL